MTARDIGGYWRNTDRIEGEIREAPGIKLRYYFKEHASCGLSQLNFNGEDTWCLQEAGRL